MKTIIQELSSAFLQFRLYDDASADIVDRKRGRTWTMGAVALQQRRWMDQDFCWLHMPRHHPEAYAGRFRAEMRGPLARITLYAPAVGGMGSFDVLYSLKDEWLNVDLIRIDEGIPCLTFPGPLEADAAVIPNHRGADLIRDAEANRFYHALEWLTVMPWYGGLLEPEGPKGAVGRFGWMAIVEEGAPNAHILRKYARCSTIWTKSLDTWDYTRRISYRLVDGGYVEMAKIFRSWAKARGLFKSLKDKIAERPRLADFIGGRNVAFMLSQPFVRSSYEDHWLDVPADHRDTPDRLEVNFTFNQARKIAEECKALGMKGGQFKFDGWGQGGYDARHPDIWPPDRAMGTLEDFKRLLAQDAPYASCIHENYNDIYEASPSFPRGVARDRDNNPIPGGMWDGGLAYRMNSRDSYRYAVANLELTKQLGMAGVYFDTLPAWPEESFEPGNQCGREESIQYRRRLLEHYQAAGFYTGGEGGKEWNMSCTDWIPAGGARTPRGQTLPLFPLVFHDCIFGFSQLGAPGPRGEFSVPMRTKCLEAMLWGWGATFRGFTHKTWPVWKRAFKDSFMVDQWQGRIALAEMANHEYLDDARLVERTEWSTGQAITVNFGKKAFPLQGTVLAPLDYRISE